MTRLGVVLVALVALGCEPRLALGTPCVYASDCPPDLTCLAGRCRSECQTFRDCPMPLDCVVLNGGVSACRVVEDDACTGPEGCTAPLVCVGGACRQPCEDGEECTPGSVCGANGCSVPPPIATLDCDPTAGVSGCAAGSRCMLAGGDFGCAPSTGTSAVGAACTGESCGDGLVCAAGRCVRVCREGSAATESSCGPDLYCAFTAIGMPEGDLPPELPEGLAYCSERCNPHGDEASDGCPDGTACALAIPRSAWKFWCRPLVAPFVAAYSSCEGAAWDCPHGTVCEIATGGTPRQCRELCRPGSSDDCSDGRTCVANEDIEGVGVCGDL